MNSPKPPPLACTPPNSRVHLSASAHNVRAFLHYLILFWARFPLQFRSYPRKPTNPKDLGSDLATCGGYIPTFQHGKHYSIDTNTAVLLYCVSRSKCRRTSTREGKAQVQPNTRWKKQQGHVPDQTGSMIVVAIHIDSINTINSILICDSQSRTCDLSSFC